MKEKKRKNERIKENDIQPNWQRSFIFEGTVMYIIAEYIQKIIWNMCEPCQTQFGLYIYGT